MDAETDGTRDRAVLYRINSLVASKEMEIHQKHDIPIVTIGRKL